MATEDIVFKVGVDPTGEGAKSLASLKKEFKDLQNELNNTQVGTDKYRQTLQKLGTVRDEIGDLNQTINALNPEGKIQAFANVAGKLAGGFQAATGAAALFGVQSEELEKQLLRVQAATALAQGIQSVVGLTDAFKVLGAVIASNPIMFLATAIAAIAAATYAWIQATDEATLANERLNENLERQNDLVKQIDEQRDSSLRRMKLNGDAERDIILESIRLSQVKVDRQKEALETQLRIVNNANEDEREAEYKKYSDMFVALDKFSLDVRQEQQKLTDFLIAEDKRQYEAKIKLAGDAAKEVSRLNREQRNNEELLRFQNEAAEAMSWEEVTLPRIQLQYNKDGELKKQTEEKKRAEIKKTSDFQKAVDDELEKRKAAQAQARLDIDTNYWNAVSDLSATFFNFQLAAAQGNAKKEEEIRKKQFQVNKAFSATKATIEGINAVQGVLAQSLLYGPLTIPLAVSMGVATAANVAKILSTPYNGGGSTSAGINTSLSSSGPQIQVQAPDVGVNTRLSESGQNLSQPVRAYVVETDVTESQQRVNRLQEQATF